MRICSRRENVSEITTSLTITQSHNQFDEFIWWFTKNKFVDLQIRSVCCNAITYSKYYYHIVFGDTHRFEFETMMNNKLLSFIIRRNLFVFLCEIACISYSEHAKPGLPTSFLSRVNIWKFLALIREISCQKCHF